MDPCPACARGQLQVDGDRAQCPACRAHFLRVAGARGGGVGREWQAESLEMVLVGAPSRRLVRREEGAQTHLEIGPPFLMRTFGAVFLAMSAACVVMSFVFSPQLLINATMGLAAGLFLRRRERISITAPEIEAGTFLWRQRLPRAGRIEVTIENCTTARDLDEVYRVRLRGPDREIVVARGMRLAREEASWLADALRKALYDAGR